MGETRADAPPGGMRRRTKRAFEALVAVLVLATANAAFGAPVVVLDAVASDQLRIRAHLERVEAELRARDASSLAPNAREARARALDRLHAYAARGVFPRNTRHSGERVPYFIDDEARACAVAHLIQASGAPALAETVRVRENNARVAAMTTDLGPWLEENGLTAEEAAQIQPTYCQCGDVYNPVCAEMAATGGGVRYTFLNECAATSCGDAFVVHEGECEPGDDITEPSCGSVCDGAPERSCSFASRPTGRRFESAWPLGASLFAALLVVLRRARRRARR